MSWTMRNLQLSPYDPLAATFESAASAARSRWEAAVEAAIDAAGGMIHEGGPVATLGFDDSDETELRLSLLDAEGHALREVVMTLRS